MSTYFVTEELMCKCGCGRSYTDNRALDMLNELRRRYNKPIILTSAYRCENHPEERKKAKPGTHYEGIAFDIKTTPQTQVELLCLAKEIGFKGFGIAKTFLHIDAREQERISAWYYG